MIEGASRCRSHCRPGLGMLFCGRPSGCSDFWWGLLGILSDGGGDKSGICENTAILHNRMRVNGSLHLKLTFNKLCAISVLNNLSGILKIK